MVAYRMQAALQCGVMAVILASVNLASRASDAPASAPLPGNHPDLNSNRDLVAATVVELRAPRADGEPALVIDVTQVFQGTLWRARHVVAWQGPASAAPAAGSRIIAFVERSGGRLAIRADDAYADTPAARNAAQARYLRIGKEDYSLEVLGAFTLVALTLFGYFGARALRGRRASPKADGAA